MFQVATLNPVVFLLGIVVNLQEKVASKLFSLTFPHTLGELGLISLGSQVLYAGEMFPDIKAGLVTKSIYLRLYFSQTLSPSIVLESTEEKQVIVH